MKLRPGDPRAEDVQCCDGRFDLVDAVGCERECVQFSTVCFLGPAYSGGLTSLTVNPLGLTTYRRRTESIEQLRTQHDINERHDQAAGERQGLRFHPGW